MALLHSLELLSLGLIWSVIVKTGAAHQLNSVSYADPSAVTANTLGVTEGHSLRCPGE